MREKDAQVDEIKKLVSEKQEVISRLEQDLARSRTELNEREGRINDVLQLEVLHPLHSVNRLKVSVCSLLLMFHPF